MEKIILIGAGGYAKSVMDALSDQDIQIEGFIDTFKKGNHLGYKILGNNIACIENPREYRYFISIGNNKARKEWFDILKKEALNLIDVFDPTAIISKKAQIGEGCFVGKMAIINSDVIIGENCIVNTKALVEHGCRLGNHINLSTNAVINGDVKVNEGAFIGSSSVINGQLTLGKNTVVGSGAVVVKPVEDNTTVVGVPAKIIKDGGNNGR